MHSKALFVFALFLTPAFSGCLDSDEIEKFNWIKKEGGNCTLNSEELLCTTYLEYFDTPIISSINPVTNELWVADLNGEIRTWNGFREYLVGNLSEYVSTCHNEQGLLGMAFSDNFTNDRKVLLSYVAEQNCDEDFASPLVLADVSVDNEILNMTTLRVLTEIEQPYRNHNAGHLLSVNNNKFLWGIGDGGGSGDPHDNGQDISTPLSSIYFFEYNGTGISPILEMEDGSKTYVLHSGLRNPWKFSLDDNGGLWIADVGQNCFEEVNYIENWTTPTNFGWSLREGKHTFSEDSECSDVVSSPPEDIVDPVIEYSHSEGHCSITGGFWLNEDSPFGEGYVHGDFCTGTVRLVERNNNTWEERVLFDSDLQIVGFGQGLNNEFLIFHWGGTIFEVSALGNNNE